jgi:hypothetical protein
VSQRDAVARLFRRSYRKKVSAIQLMRVGGALAWRTRVSEARRELGMDIRNELTRHKGTVRSVYVYCGRLKGKAA